MRLLFFVLFIAIAIWFFTGDDGFCHQRPSNPNAALDAPFCDER